VLSARLISSGANIKGELSKIESGTLDLSGIDMYKQYLICVDNYLSKHRSVANDPDTLSRSHNLKKKDKSSELSNSASLNGLIFTIKNAVLEGDKLTVNFKITSPDKDRIISMKNGGEAFVIIDGEEYRHSLLQIGKSKGYKLYSGVTIPRDMSINSFVTFKSVSGNAEKIDMLRILFWSEKITFRDIKVA